MKYFYSLLKKGAFLFIIYLFSTNPTFSQPVISSFTPTSGTVGTVISIRGHNFADTSRVSFGGRNASSATVFGDTLIQAVVGLGATGNIIVSGYGVSDTISGFVFIVPPPTITSFSPTSAAQGATVTIIGTYLNYVTSVSFGGVPASSFYVQAGSTTKIIATVGAGASGNVSVTSSGGTAVLAGFTYISPVSITSFSPTTATAGATVTIEGNNFSNITNVSFGGKSATSFTVVSSTEITAVVAPGSSSGNVVVTGQAGSGTLSGFIYLNPPPTITSFTPTAATVGTTITITGTNFDSVTAVLFGNVPVKSFSIISATTITAIIDTGASGNVTVVSPGGTASLAGFTYIIDIPTIASFTPAIGGNGTTVTINGTNFTRTTSVSFGNIPAKSFSIVSPTVISAVVDNGASGNVNVSTPRGTASSPGFTYVPAPLINSFTPSSTSTGDTVTITGAYFTNASSVSFGGTAASSFIIQSDGVILAVVGSGSSGNVSITTPYGSTTFGGFNYILSTKITSLSPTSGVQGSVITIHGISFTGTTAVSFGGVAAASFTVVSDSVITAIVGNGNSGNVVVVTPRNSSAIGGFIYLSQTGITSFYPTSGSAGSSIAIHGISFKGTTSVSIGGAPALSFVVAYDTLINAVVGNGTTGAVTVSSPQGTASLSTFTFTSIPVITSFYPESGPIGTSVTIVGQNFDSNPANDFVSFGAVRATVLSASNDTLVVSAPAGTTFQPISVSTNTLTAYAQKPFALTFSNGSMFDSTSFSKEKNFPTYKSSNALAVGDLDGDGKIDVVTFQPYLQQAVDILQNITSDTIALTQLKQNFLVPSINAGLIADVDGDGKPDMPCSAYSTVASGLSFNFSSVGTIRMSQPNAVFANVPSTDIKIGDIDQDGKTDVVLINATATTPIFVFRNAGTTGTTSYKRNAVTTSGIIYDASVADIDGDGKPDLVASGNTTFTVLLNNSTIGNIAFAAGVDFSISQVSSRIVTADIDGDGKKDVILFYSSGTFISIFRNTSTAGNVSFDAKVDISIGTVAGFSKSPFDFGDLDGDGRPDLAVVMSTGGISLLRNTSTPGNISFAQGVAFPMSSKAVSSLAIADMDNDGKQDIICLTNDTQNPVSILKNLINPGPPPSIISFSPSSAKKGDTVVISGTYLSSTHAVSFGNVPASSFVVVSDSVVKAVVGIGASGSVMISTASDTASKTGFTFLSTPGTVIYSFYPDSAATGTTLTIKGKYFTGATAVTFGDSTAASFTVVSDSVINAIVGNGKSGNVIVFAQGSDTASGFTYIQTQTVKIPTIISFSPDSAASGATVTIKGKNFSAATNVSFGGTPASFTVISDSVINAVVGNGASGNIVVTSSSGADTITGFTFIPAVIIPSDFQLISFSGSIQNAQAILNWETEKEQGILSFTIQHGADSLHFTDLYTMNATGNDGPYFYSYIDSLPQYQNNYYRIKINASTGDSSFSKIIYLQLEDNPQHMNIYPNPATGNVIINTPISTFVSFINIMDFTGRIIQRVQVNPGVVQTRIDVSLLSNGIYAIQWSDGARPVGMQFSVLH